MLSTDDQPALTELVELVGGFAFGDGTLVRVPEVDRRIAALRTRLETSTDNRDLVAVVRWFFADRAMRTISPLSAMTQEEYRKRTNELAADRKQRPRK